MKKLNVLIAVSLATAASAAFAQTMPMQDQQQMQMQPQAQSAEPGAQTMQPQDETQMQPQAQTQMQPQAEAQMQPRYRARGSHENLARENARINSSQSTPVPAYSEQAAQAQAMPATGQQQYYRVAQVGRDASDNTGGTAANSGSYGASMYGTSQSGPRAVIQVPDGPKN